MKCLTNIWPTFACTFPVNMDLFQCCSSQWEEYLCDRPGLDPQENTASTGKVTEELRLIRSFVMSPRC